MFNPSRKHSLAYSVKSIPFRGFRFYIFAVVLCVTTSIQALTPPTQIIDSFNRQFPEANKIHWFETGIKNKEYRASYRMGNVPTNSYFNAKGSLIETDREIPSTGLPESLVASLEKQYGVYKILKTLAIERNGVVNIYEITLKSEEGDKSTIIVTKEGYYTPR